MEEKNKNNLLAVKISLIVIVLLIIGGLLIFRLGNRVERMSKVEAYTYNLLISIKIYESTYGFLPWADKNDKKIGANIPVAYDTLIEYLTCVAGPNNTSTAAGNLNNIQILDTPSDYRKLGFVDPWGQRFNIYLDLNYDNKVKIKGKEETGTVFVYSSGPNKKDEEGGGDDICSWKN